METKLQAIYSTRQSFYGKAKIDTAIFNDIEHIELLSYNTLVATYVDYKTLRVKIYEYFGRYSRTTSCHQKEFFRQLGLSEKEVKDLMKDGTYKTLKILY